MKTEYSNGKIRILALLKILNEKPQNASQLIRKLERLYDIKAHRHTIYDDIAVLTQFEDVRQTTKGYYIRRAQQ